MPPIADKSTVPDNLKPYIFHGVDLGMPKGGEAIGDCPFCGREGKFSVKVETGQYRCLVCAEGTNRGGGNAYVFIRHYWDLCYKVAANYEMLAHEWKLLYPETLQRWNVTRSLSTGRWLIPGYAADGGLNQLYEYTQVGDRHVMMPTPTLGMQMHGVHLWDSVKPIVDLCEGAKDGMAWWEVLRRSKETESGWMNTGSEGASLLKDRNVLAVPGCNVSNALITSFLPMFGGKVVNLRFDNDHPGKNEKTGDRIEPAGHQHMRRICKMLTDSTNLTPPAQLNYMQWSGSYELDHAADLPGGWDYRDGINEEQQ